MAAWTSTISSNGTMPLTSQLFLDLNFLNTVADHHTILQMKICKNWHPECTTRIEMELGGSHAAVKPNELCDERLLFRLPVRLSPLLPLDIHENNLCAVITEWVTASRYNAA
jgi:hypothetical protein